MNNNAETVAKELLSEEKIGKINANSEKLSKIFSSPQGANLIAALSKDGGRKLGKAVADAQQGNIETAKQMISALASTEEGREIISQIIAIAE